MIELEGILNIEDELEGSAEQAGPPGVDGRGIVSVVKTAEQGEYDVYTITYTDLTTSTFTIKRGSKGDKGDPGAVHMIPVAVLPDPSEAETDAIYLVPSADPQSQNTYDEWVVVNGAWEKIGSGASVDLDNYYTKTETDGKISDHNASTAAHQDIRDLVNGKSRAVWAVAIYETSSFASKVPRNTIVVNFTGSSYILCADATRLYYDDINSGDLICVWNTTGTGNWGIKWDAYLVGNKPTDSSKYVQLYNITAVCNDLTTLYSDCVYPVDANTMKNYVDGQIAQKADKDAVPYFVTNESDFDEVLAMSNAGRVVLYDDKTSRYPGLYLAQKVVGTNIWFYSLSRPYDYSISNGTFVQKFLIIMAIKNTATGKIDMGSFIASDSIAFSIIDQTLSDKATKLPSSAAVKNYVDSNAKKRYLHTIQITATDMDDHEIDFTLSAYSSKATEYEDFAELSTAFDGMTLPIFKFFGTDKLYNAIEFLDGDGTLHGYSYVAISGFGPEETLFGGSSVSLFVDTVKEV